MICTKFSSCDYMMDDERLYSFQSFYKLLSDLIWDYIECNGIDINGGDDSIYFFVSCHSSTHQPNEMVIRLSVGIINVFRDNIDDTGEEIDGFRHIVGFSEENDSYYNYWVFTGLYTMSCGVGSTVFLEKNYYPSIVSGIKTLSKKFSIKY